MYVKKIFKYIMCFVLTTFSFCAFVFATTTTNNATECAKLAEFQTDLQNIFDLMKFIVPLLVVGLSTYDFIKAIAQKDDKDVKKAFQRLMKRFIYAIILFFLPVLLTLVLNLLIENASVCIS